jgi:fructose-1,6-bisphosphatase/inositol monophosphatase family enzyme
VDTFEIGQLLYEVADEYILPRFGANPSAQQIEIKTNKNDVATIADREAEQAIRARLEGEYPDALIVGEEATFANPDLLFQLPEAEHGWVIDPVDGTLNFTKESPDFAVMLAETRFGKPVRSWIYQPLHRAMWAAELGAGVERDGKLVKAPKAHDRELVGATYVPFKREAELPFTCRRSWGSCGIDYPKLILGEVDFLAYRSLYPWDHLPGGLMVTELGGRQAVEDGDDYQAGTVGKRIVTAMNPATWEHANDILNEYARV